MPLQHTHRPTTWGEVKGNDQSIHALEAVVSRKEGRPHAYLLTGPAGVGKTTLMRIIATALHAGPSDFQELNTADFRGIDMVRELRQKARLHPLGGPVRVWGLDECHQLSGDAQEALLKLLEEPPEHAYFVLATTVPEKLRPTLKRRCHHCPLAPLSDRLISQLVGEIWHKEMDGGLPAGLADAITAAAAGSPGVALKSLDEVIDLDPTEMAQAVAHKAEVQVDTIELVRALTQRAPWKTVAALINKLKGEDPEGVRRLALAYAQTILLSGKDDARAALVLLGLRDHPTYDTGWPGLTGTCYEILQ